MLPRTVEVSSLAAARDVLDRFAIAERLQHVRQFVWRGGTLRLGASDDPADVWYELEAHWETAILQDVGAAGLVRSSGPLIEGRWTRGQSSYSLRAGIDLAVPSAIYIRSDRHASFVPFLGRLESDVERALEADFSSYANAFLDTCRTVPQAVAYGAARLQQLGLLE